MEKMKLLVVNDAKIYRHGGEYFANDTFPIFMKELSGQCRMVTMCSPVVEASSEDTGKFRKFLSDGDPAMECVSSFPHDSFIDYFRKLYKAVFMIPEFAGLVKRSDAALLRTNGLNIFFVAAICSYYRKPVFTYVVGYPEHILKTGSKYRNRLYPLMSFLGRMHTLCLKWLIGRAGANFFVSEYLMSELGDGKDNGHVIYTNLIRRGDITFVNKEPAGETTRIIYVGRLVHEKGLDHLIRAIRLLIDAGMAAELRIVGDGPEKARLENLSRELGIESHCRFLGQISYGGELNGVYQGGDVFVLPSLSEGMGKVLLEAMANGLPVVASDVGGIPYLIENMKNGVLVPPGNPEAIARAVRTIVENDDLRKDLVRNGYNFVESHTAEKETEKLAALMRRYVHGTGLARTGGARDKLLKQ